MNSDNRFEFFLAEKLSMTVGELRQRMTYEEFIGWARYYGLYKTDEDIEKTLMGLKSKYG